MNNVIESFVLCPNYCRTICMIQPFK
uniref:Uncharacterized protein n=1 Tax=Rhizophora mucronata TaxID=61149 RepID=A0A2P2NX15_RHIMU